VLGMPFIVLFVFVQRFSELPLSFRSADFWQEESEVAASGDAAGKGHILTLLGMTNSRNSMLLGALRGEAFPRLTRRKSTCYGNQSDMDIHIFWQPATASLIEVDFVFR